MAHEILIVDDEADIRSLVAGILQDEGYQTREAGDSSAALAAIVARRPSLVLLDIWLQGSEMDGLGILRLVKREHPDLPVVMMSGHGNIETAVSAIQMGAYDFIEKPFKADRMMLVLGRAIEAMKLRRENAELKIKAGGDQELIGRSPAIVALRSAIAKVAPTNSRILIVGPAGSGKEVAARLLHDRSRRAGGAFVVLNCATLESSRFEEELFGTETGGEGGGGRKVGTFEQAHMGTLFLDEVADLPKETQGKLVRVLQDQTFTRLGGKAKVQVDVRVVAATTRDLTAEIAEGRFREDLYYRLNVVPLSLPPLCQRREDIPELTAHFVQRIAEAMGQAPRPLGEDAVVALQTYDWPGNVRELRNLVERVIIMAPGKAGEPIRADALPVEVTAEAPAALRMDAASQVMSLPLREARELFEREYLITQVTRFGGNISRTAQFIGMERSALHRKLKLLGVQVEGRAKGEGEDAAAGEDENRVG